jgi:hypothetical protein
MITFLFTQPLFATLTGRGNQTACIIEFTTITNVLSKLITDLNNLAPKQALI